MIDSQSSTNKAMDSLQMTQLSEDELSGSYNRLESHDFMMKDETELKLEKLVFGDSTGFQISLDADQPDTFSQPPSEKLAGTWYDEVDSGPEGGLEGLDNADVCTPALLGKFQLLTLSAIFF